MKTRISLFVLIFSIVSSVCGCGDVVAPEKTTGSITFVITEENTPQTLSEVAIQLFFDEDKSITQSDRTDKSGRCTFSDIPVGTYSVNLSKPGYESKEGLALRITGKDNPNKEIGLKRITTELTVQPKILDFGADESVRQKAFSIVNPNYVDLTWAALETDVPWIVSVCDKDGKKNGIIKYNQEVAMSVTIDRNKLAIGDNESTIVILSDYGRAELTIKAVGADTRTFPTTNMLEVTDVDMSSATFKGEILSAGTPEYTERGFVYSRSSIPVDATSGFSQKAATMDSNKAFSVSVNDLWNGYTYHVRAYAKNSVGMSLSTNEITFRTIGSITTVRTKEVAYIDAVNGNALFIGEIIKAGDPSYSEKGFCYNTNDEPTVSDKKNAVSGTGSGEYAFLCDGLSKNTTYYVRAYAIQNNKTYYGSTIKFNTDKSSQDCFPSVSTGQPTAYSTKIYVTGKVTDEGATAVTKRGVCYSTDNSTPTTSNHTIENGSGSGSFDIQITGLTKNTKYYLRAFATNENGTSYGECRSINTTNGLPIVTTDKNCTSGVDYLEVTGSSSTESEYPITRQGVCWSTSGNPSIYDNVVPAASTVSPFSCRITGLQQGSTYYCRAFAENSNGLSYGSSYAFTTNYKATTLHGHVYDQDGKPVASAKISGTATPTTTDNNGYYSVTLDITESKYYSFFCSCDGYKSQDKNTYITRGQDNQLDFNLTLENNFAVDFGDGYFIKSGEFWLMYFECAQTNLPGTKTSKNMRIKNYRSVPVSWNLSTLPTKGITFSPQKGTIASNSEVTINVTFTYPSPSTTGSTMLRSNNGTKLYVWPWQGYYVDCYINTSTNEGITNPGSACCAHDVYLQVDNHSEAFELAFNQFVSYR